MHWVAGDPVRNPEMRNERYRSCERFEGSPDRIDT